jgi:hypothetical protein
VELGLAAAQYDAKQYAEAVVTLKDAIRTKGDTVDADTALGNVYAAMGDKASAKAYYQKVVEYYNAHESVKPDYGPYYEALIEGLDQ